MKRSKKEILKKLRQEGSIITPDILNNVYKAIGVDPITIGEKPILRFLKTYSETKKKINREISVQEF